MTRVKEQGKLLVEQESQTHIGRDAIIKSIEARWNKWDQEIFISTVLVNPFYRTAPRALQHCEFLVEHLGDIYQALSSLFHCPTTF